MSVLNKFTSINQFRHIVSHVRSYGKYHKLLELPTLRFTGTVKIHGTNGGIGYNPETGEIWAQSRENLITTKQDNHNFAKFVEDNIDFFKKLFENLQSVVESEKGSLMIFGEWFGSGIQKKVAISNMEKKHFAVFEVANVFLTDEIDGNGNPVKQSIKYGVDVIQEDVSEHPDISLITEFGRYEMNIDFNEPEMSVPKLQELTTEVEKECPVGKAFGFEGTGEGIVWSTYFNNELIRFKVKGEKHSVSKVKKMADVDVERLNSIKEFVEYSVTENRMEQGLQMVFGEEEIDVKKMGDLIRWVNNDIFKEEIDVIEENKFERKELGRPIADKCRKWFMEKLNQF